MCALLVEGDANTLSRSFAYIHSCWQRFAWPQDTCTTQNPREKGPAPLCLHFVWESRKHHGEHSVSRMSKSPTFSATFPRALYRCKMSCASSACKQGLTEGKELFLDSRLTLHVSPPPDFELRDWPKRKGFGEVFFLDSPRAHDPHHLRF